MTTRAIPNRCKPDLRFPDLDISTLLLKNQIQRKLQRKIDDQPSAAIFCWFCGWFLQNSPFEMNRLYIVGSRSTKLRLYPWKNRVIGLCSWFESVLSGPHEFSKITR